MGGGHLGKKKNSSEEMLKISGKQDKII